MIIMENYKDKTNLNYLRWCISIVLLIILLIHLFLYKNQPSTFHFIILGILLIFGIADRFKVIKIPGVIELKDKTESIDKKLDKVVNQIQQIQTQGVNLYINPQPQTASSQSPKTESLEEKSSNSENK
jgi:hypothetical protein